MSFGNATLRGGQTLLHDARMWGQLARWGIVGSRTRHRPDPCGEHLHHDERARVARPGTRDLGRGQARHRVFPRFGPEV